MNTAFNFDRMFGEPQERDVENKEIFKKAALLYEFDLEKDFKDFPAGEVALLKSKTHPRSNGKYVLPEDTMKIVLAEKIGIENIAEEIDKNEIHSEFSDVMLKTLRAKEVNYEAMSDTDLFYSSKIARIFPDKLDEKTSKCYFLKRQFFHPFEKITQNFAGREKELDQINQFVYALPDPLLSMPALKTSRQPLLIQGIGGVGKSTLMSKFIFDQNIVKKAGKLPFVYIDFDLPGFTIKEPLNILLESLRQLIIQFPEFEEILQKVIRTVSTMTFAPKEDAQEFYKSSTISQRGLIYGSVDELMDAYGLDVNRINLPVLLVFDSFEEMQYRATRAEIGNFFSFIWEIIQKLPFVRPVFVGRSEISETVGDFRFDKIELKEFDLESAAAFLKKNKIADKELCRRIYETFGGNPLILCLASDLVKKDPKALDDFDKVNDKKQEFLINRILGHIHDPDVQKIAVPGMLVRRINPEVIRMVLAEPCHLKKLNEEEAKVLFEKLRKEVAIISKATDADEFVFRQDLRMACEEMIKEKFSEESKMIVENAIRFYESNQSRGPEYEAEFYYHLLKEGNIPPSFTKTTYERIRPELEPAIIELPEKVQLFISSLQGSRTSQNFLDHASVEEWERYYLGQIQESLNNELQHLSKLHEEVNARTERSSRPESEFPYFEALLHQRTNHLYQSNKVIARALDLIAGNKDLTKLRDGLAVLEIQNLEYEGKYTDALAKCTDFLPKPGNNLCKREFLYARLQMRVNETDYDWTQAGQHYVPDFSGNFIDTYWNTLFRGASKVTFQKADDFDLSLQKLSRSIGGMVQLETYCKEQTGMFLKDMSLAGTFEILLRDVLYMMEAKGKNV